MPRDTWQQPLEPWGPRVPPVTGVLALLLKLPGPTPPCSPEFPGISDWLRTAGQIMSSEGLVLWFFHQAFGDPTQGLPASRVAGV